MYLEVLTWRHIRESSDLGWGVWEGWTDNRLKFLPLVGYAGRRVDTDELVGVGGVAWLGPKALAWLGLAPGFAGSKAARCALQAQR